MHIKRVVPSEVKILLDRLVHYGFERQRIKDVGDYVWVRKCRNGKKRYAVHIFSDGSMGFYDLRKYKFVNEPEDAKKMLKELIEGGLIEE